jgi:hypothetical protein
VFPVEEWMALIFAADPDKAADMPAAWHGVFIAMQLVVEFLGQPGFKL